MLVKHFHARTLLQGRPRRLKRALALRYGSCLLPLKLFFLHIQAMAFSSPPFLGDFIRIIRPSRTLARFCTDQIRVPRVSMLPFRVPFAKRNLLTALFVMKERAGLIQTHWLTVTTVDRYPITVFILPAET
jgi:hypothetical protein